MFVKLRFKLLQHAGSLTLRYSFVYYSEHNRIWLKQECDSMRTQRTVPHRLKDFELGSVTGKVDLGESLGIRIQKN